jgi:hypothetical protein
MDFFRLLSFLSAIRTSCAPNRCTPVRRTEEWPQETKEVKKGAGTGPMSFFRLLSFFRQFRRSRCTEPVHASGPKEEWPQKTKEVKKGAAQDPPILSPSFVSFGNSGEAAAPNRCTRFSPRSDF